jgi:hypothetical protein
MNLLNPPVEWINWVSLIIQSQSSCKPHCKCIGRGSSGSCLRCSTQPGTNTCWRLLFGQINQISKDGGVNLPLLGNWSVWSWLAEVEVYRMIPTSDAWVGLLWWSILDSIFQVWNIHPWTMDGELPNCLVSIRYFKKQSIND